MRVRLSTRKLMLVIVIVAACLALGRRVWFSEWAPFYFKRYQDASRWVLTLEQNEASYRTAGEIEKARQVQGILEFADQERRDSFRNWVKALFLDEP